MAPWSLIFAIAMGANCIFELISLDTSAPWFLGRKNSSLGGVSPLTVSVKYVTASNLQTGPAQLKKVSNGFLGPRG